MLDPLWLTSFATVAETLNFTSAATRLGIRQPTVSEHIRKLERACGRRLFVRDTHRVAITADGEAMLGFAASILETQARAARHFAGEDIHGRIRLGVSEDVVLKGLPRDLRRFIAEHPRVEVELTVGLSEDVRGRLEAGDLDLAFVKRRVGDRHGELAWREPLVWIAAPDFRVDAHRSIPLVVLAPPALTRSAALTALEKHGRQWHVVCTSGSQSGIHAAVAAGLGVAPHARSLVPESLTEFSGRQLPPLGDVEFVVISGRGANRGPVRALAAVIQKNAALLRATSVGHRVRHA